MVLCKCAIYIPWNCHDCFTKCTKIMDKNRNKRRSFSVKHPLLIVTYIEGCASCGRRRALIFDIILLTDVIPISVFPSLLLHSRISRIDRFFIKHLWEELIRWLFLFIFVLLCWYLFFYSFIFNHMFIRNNLFLWVSAPVLRRALWNSVQQHWYGLWWGGCHQAHTRNFLHVSLSQSHFWVL